MNEGDNPENGFVLHALPRSLSLRARSEREMLDWVDALNTHGRIDLMEG